MKASNRAAVRRQTGADADWPVLHGERAAMTSRLRPGVPRSQSDLRLPLYEQVKASLLNDIRSGALHEGDRLPPEPELCASLRVSRTVVRQAVGELAQEGYLSRKQGLGTFVRAPKLTEYFLDSADGFHDDFASRGYTVLSSVLSCTEQEPRNDVRTALETRQRRVVVLDRIRSVDSTPLAFTRSFLAKRLHSNLLGLLNQSDLAKQSLYALLREAAGVSVVSATRRIEAVNADATKAKLLDTSTGTALLLIRSVCRDGHGVPVEYFESWHRADLAAFELRVSGHAGSPEERLIPNERAD